MRRVLYITPPGAWRTCILILRSSLSSLFLVGTYSEIEIPFHANKQIDFSNINDIDIRWGLFNGSL